MLPTLYTWNYVLYSYMHNGVSNRLKIVVLFQTIWSIRLTWNYASRGGYDKGSEDYRWVHVHKWFPHPVVWNTFNLVFISIIQNGLLLWLSTPAYLVMEVGNRKSLGFWDFTLALMNAACLCVEMISDHQQNTFHAVKASHKDKKSNKGDVCTLTDVERGFFTGGLFKYSRHPNFAAEQSIWWIQYLFGVVASGSFINWTIPGAIGLNGIFTGSTLLTEYISKNKYPAYAQYQKSVPMFFPKINSKME